MGLSGAGKTTLAQALKPLMDLKYGNTVILDGDELRAGLCQGLGFDPASRKENIRRCAEVAKLVLASGGNVIASCITPYESQRELVRDCLLEYDLYLVYLSASIDVCEVRDTKGLYKKFREQGGFPLTGKGDLFEEPSSEVIELDSGVLTVDQSIDYLLDKVDR